MDGKEKRENVKIAAGDGRRLEISPHFSSSSCGRLGKPNLQAVEQPPWRIRNIYNVNRRQRQMSRKLQINFSQEWARKQLWEIYG